MPAMSECTAAVAAVHMWMRDSAHDVVQLMMIVRLSSFCRCKIVHMPQSTVLLPYNVAAV